MTKSLPPLNWFRAFEAAARNLSFTAAAEEIGMTQSAVSQQVKSLEMRLGVPLFERKARGLALTDHGRRLLPQVDAALGTLSVATGAFFTDKPANLLTVSASISVIEWLIAPALAQFTAAHPDIAVRFVSAIWPDEFSRTVADIEVRFGSKKQATPAAEMLGRNLLVPLKPPSMKGDIGALPLIDAVGTSDGWKVWGRAADYPDLSPSLFVDSYGLALQLAVQGNGVCLVSELLSAHPLRAGLVELAHDVTIPANQNYFLSIRQDSDAARSFKDWIMTTSQDRIPAG
jgi:LysR family glycine cleavage system transcriptional activator